MQNTLLIHIGYHKTATTWMQNRLFIPDHGYYQIADHEDVFRDIVEPHGLSFSPMPMKNRISSKLSNLRNQCIAVISSELLSGHPFSGGRESEEYAARLYRIAPNAKILVSIRSQLRILPSIYMQYLLRGGTQPYDKFFEDKNELGYFSFSTLHFEYDRLISLYQNIFGTENVHILTQESLRNDVDRTVAELAKFCGNQGFKNLVPAARKAQSPSYPEHAVPILRRINHLQSSILNPTPVINLGETPYGLYRLFGYALKRAPLSTLLAQYRPVSKYVQDRFSGRFTDSNIRLEALTSGRLDLSSYD